MTEEIKVEYPECEKLSAVADKRTLILDFLQWLGEKDMHIMRSIGDQYPEWCHITQRAEQLSHQYLEIDDKKLEQERRHMLESLRDDPIKPKVKELK